jgi:hypothetical protein
MVIHVQDLAAYRRSRASNMCHPVLTMAGSHPRYVSCTSLVPVMDPPRCAMFKRNLDLQAEERGFSTATLKARVPRSQAKSIR